MHRTTSIFALLGAGALAGCVEPPDENTATSAATISDPCEQEWRCGGNSPVLDVRGTTVEFHELNVQGLANDVGLTLQTVNGHAQLSLNGQSRDLYIGSDGLYAGSTASGFLYGDQLIGGEMVITSVKTRFNLKITNVRTMSYPFPAGTRETLTVYRLEVPSSTGTSRNLCANPTEVDAMGMAANEALIYGGDRFDTHTKTVAEFPGEGWFNIGCAGHTLAKLHLTRNTTASQGGASRDKRQAALKLLTGDYCGTGVGFTLPGQRLQWKGSGRDAKSEYLASMIHDPIEARWDANGAKCLTMARLERSSLPNAATLFPNVAKSIAKECAAVGRVLALCDPDDAERLADGLWVSALGE